MRSPPKAVDLFCGAGGLSEGLRRAGYTIVGAVEIDALACAVYRANHDSVRLWERDIRRVTGTELMRELRLRKGELDLLAACPPCQGFSAIRTRNGQRRNRDKRNDLIADVLRLARSLRPKAIMLENVPGLAKNRRFFQLCSGLAALGFRLKWQVLDAADFGVPQRRKRLVLIGSRVFEPEFAAKARCRRTVRQAIGRLASPGRSRDELHGYAVRLSPRVKSMIKRIPKNGGSRAALSSEQELRCHRDLDGFRDVYGRMEWDRPSPTLTGGCINPSKGRFLHPTANRPITLREAALLQTFPSSYRFPLDHGRYAAATLIGNALPPEFIRRHALALTNSTREAGIASGQV